VYRIHEPPDSEKLQKVVGHAHNLGYHLPVTEKGVSGKALQQLLADISGTPEEAVLGQVILRSMKQARYTAENSGHFGLAARDYCHFTSPIRRYPDLLVHRAIKEFAGEKKNSQSDIMRPLF
jgi:ribonuclease R